MLNRHGFLGSVSRNGEIAAMMRQWESFFHSLTVEQTERKSCATRGEAKAVFEYIESCYNRKRRHSTRDYLLPCDFEARMAA
ncbi:IS3 family transposase [Methylococcus sp. EFPC2]|uniref:IS3 family transposase n=1 Tax=Methylococcus sp. EFPC2 TaxID=2812648 RepID=UPI00196847C7|nr:IS3 family transposase [Methylococcus sp. EFPC2]QSA98194.1 IS3 family transposase [Methylococcus sp. EFPC2]